MSRYLKTGALPKDWVGAELDAVWSAARWDAVAANATMSISLSEAIMAGEVTSADAQEITEAINNAIDSLPTTGGTLIFPSGKYYLDPAYGVSLSMSTYSYGDAALNACMVLPYKTRVITAGPSTEFWPVNMDEDTSVVVAIGEDGATGSGHSQKSFRMDGFSIRAPDLGRYGVITPENANLHANKRPRYSLGHIHFCGDNDSDTILSSPAKGFTNGVLVGDCYSVDGFLTGSGTFNPLVTESGQHQMTGFRCTAAGAFGVNVRMIMKCLYAGISLGDGVEGFSLRDSEIWDSWEGVVLDATVGEPGGFIDNCHFNVNRCGIRAEFRQSLHIGKVEVFRSDDYDDHASDWDALKLTSCGSVDVGRLYVLHGSLLDRTNSRAVNGSASTVKVDSWHAQCVNTVAILDECPDCEFGDGVTHTVTTVYDLRGTNTNDFKAGNVKTRSGSVTSFAVMDGDIIEERIDLPQDSNLSLRRYQAISPTDNGTTTITKRLSPSTLKVTMNAGAGAHTHDIILSRSGVVPGDRVRIKILGSASANPTLRICDDDTGTILSTFNSISTIRLVADYVVTGSNVWEEETIHQSIEATY